MFGRRSWPASETTGRTYSAANRPHPAAAPPPSPRGRGKDWPTYRRDARRSGFQDLPAPRELSAVWTEKLATPLTAPVVAGGTVFVAETDRHALHALSARDGKRRWTFLADGRIDSPPTIHDGRVLFGSRDGAVYCLRAEDGTLVWRFRTAPRDRRVVALGQLESVWPVNGSVLVLNGDVFFVAGRSSYLDGGLHLLQVAHSLNPQHVHPTLGQRRGLFGKGVARLFKGQLAQWFQEFSSRPNGPGHGHRPRYSFGLGADQPGIIAKVSTFFHRYNINIENCTTISRGNFFSMEMKTLTSIRPG